MHHRDSVAHGVIGLLVALGAAVLPASVDAHPVSSDVALKGLASWYGDAHHGRRTANGEVFDQEALTAAHPSLPFGTMVRVTNLRNGRTVEVRVNDRGPVIAGRIIDLSRAAARAIGSVGRGVVPVRLEVVPAPSNVRAATVSRGN